MRQLVQLNESAERFDELGVEVIAVFREEKAGVAGLRKIVDRTETPFTLCVDLGAKNTARYSSGRMEFDNYVIDSTGNVVAMIDGTLRERATAEQLFEVLEGLSEEAGETGEAEAGSGAKEAGSGAKEAGSGAKEAGSGAKEAGSAPKAGSGSR